MKMKPALEKLGRFISIMKEEQEREFKQRQEQDLACFFAIRGDKEFKSFRMNECAIGSVTKSDMRFLKFEHGTWLLDSTKIGKRRVFSEVAPS